MEQLDRRACRTAAEDRFSMERMVVEHLVVYERVMRTHRALRVA